MEHVVGYLMLAYGIAVIFRSRLFLRLLSCEWSLHSFIDFKLQKKFDLINLLTIPVGEYLDVLLILMLMVKS